MVPKTRHLVAILIGSLAVYSLVYFLVATSEAYEYGSNFVREDQRIVALTGQQRSQRLSFWSGFNYAFGDADGEASLTLRIEGVRGTFEIPIDLRKRHGRWSVVSATAISEKGEKVVIVE